MFPRDYGRLLISCPDRPGIVAAVAQFLFEHDANIVQSDQYSTDANGGQFFMRVEFDMPNLNLHYQTLCSEFQKVARQFQITYQISLAAVPKRLAVFVSKEDHCLRELLWLWQSNELCADLRFVISNHDDARALVESFDIPFFHIPVNSDNKVDAEMKQLEMVAGHVDVIALARYMQILSPQFLARFPGRIINIHHSFLPAFIGRNPYKQAYDRGVKIIGATAHYVTEDLDEGPIIEQDVGRVTHHHDAAELKRIGRQIERSVFTRAVKWHLEDKVLVHENKTIVFN